jgi:hypothetical protein
MTVNTIANQTAGTSDEAVEKSHKRMLAEIEVESARIELLKRRGELADRDQSRRHREKYVDRLFWLMLFSIILAWLSVFLSGNSIGNFLIYVAPSVQIALHSTTTVEVIGLFVLVVKYMFK